MYDAVFIQSRHVRNHLICEFELCSIRETWISEARHVNYRVAVGLLIGQGWEQWRPTLPKLYVSKARPKALVFLRLNYQFRVNRWLKTMSFANSICPHVRLSTGQQLR